MGQITRRTALGAAAGCLLAGVGGVLGVAADASPAYRSGMRTSTHRSRHGAQPDGVFAISTRRRMVAMTFDDGPDPQYTPRVLDLLDQYEAGATFFSVGANVLVWRDLAHTVVRRGHSTGWPGRWTCGRRSGPSASRPCTPSRPARVTSPG